VQSLVDLVRSVVRNELAQSVMPVVDAQVNSLTLTRANVEKIVNGIDDRIDARLKSSRDAIFDLIAAQNAHLSMFTAAMTKQMEGLNLSIGRVAGDGAPSVVVDATAVDVIMRNVV
jgi:selenocysteine lyase/cysteine desulfurase